MFTRLRASAAVVGTTLTTAALLLAGPVTAHAATAVPAGVLGMDVYQDTGKNINWSAASSAGARFVYIKASGGKKITNDYFSQQWEGAKSAGLLVGAYHLAAPNLSSGTSQADYFVSQGAQWQAGGEVLPPMVDLEVNTSAQQPGVSACYGMSPSAISTWITQFSAEIADKTGRVPVIYTSFTFWNACVGNSKSFSTNPLFIAKYGTSAGTLPASWATYDLWQYAGAGTSSIPGDQDVFNGTLTSLHLLADPTYGSGTAATTKNHDYNGDGKSDVLTRFGSTGSIRLYRGDGTGRVGGYTTVGNGFSSFTAVIPAGDANGDGVPDVWLRASDGTLSFHPGVAGGGFGHSKTVGTGFNSFNQLVGVGDFNGDGKPDLLARDAVGTLWLYEGDGTGGFVGRVQISAGWSAFTAIIGVQNFTGTGTTGIIVETSSGQMLYYARQSVGFAGHTVIGNGWNAYNAVVSPGDLTGDGRSDLFVRDAKGNVSSYEATGTGALTGRKPIASGWSPFTWIG